MSHHDLVLCAGDRQAFSRALADTLREQQPPLVVVEERRPQLTIPQLLTKILARLEVIEARQLGAAESGDLLRCGQVDREYRIRKGTALAHARNGDVKSRIQRRGGKDTYLIPRSECERVWGAT